MKEISAKELEEIVGKGKSLNIVDVREDEEVATGMIPNTLHIPLGEIESRESELDKNKDYIFVCRSGRRSAMACEFLEAKGYNVTNMTGGMLDWAGPTK
ncbi:rhodanese-like domain-containing protein [Aquibacillus albus]|uniref:Rhodanese-related sulfurtransferase n=1 Tax=Aquibacillus albus TaxID=1168171 RepID=A0ABS2N2F2_9BACI|nr:rhodanese-related sulfurtransferase [Aquibacillus albus]